MRCCKLVAWNRKVEVGADKAECEAEAVGILRIRS